MNNTKWDEIRLGMYTLAELAPRWRTKDVKNGYISEWDGEWFHHFRSGGYACIEWLEILTISPGQAAAVAEVLHAIHVPGERQENGFRVYGYAPVGQFIDFLMPD